MRRKLLKAQLSLFGTCYSATLEAANASGKGLPVPTKGWAHRSAVRRTQRTGLPWGITKFSRR